MAARPLSLTTLEAAFLRATQREVAPIARQINALAQQADAIHRRALDEIATARGVSGASWRLAPGEDGALAIVEGEEAAGPNPGRTSDA